MLVELVNSKITRDALNNDTGFSLSPWFRKVFSDIHVFLNT